MSWDEVWEGVFQRQSWGKYPDESFIRFAARNFYKVQPRSRVKILEVGCGPGANIWYLAREGFDAYGIDGSATAVAQARERLAQENLSAHLSVGDIIRLPYADGQFDAVADNECLAHNSTRNMPQILAEIDRVLKPQGLLYSRTFTDRVYMGQQRQQLGPMEYSDVSDGPFAGRGFVRLIDREGIGKLYGQFFNLICVDRREYSQDDEKMNISEWIIYAQKR
ncbi:MAG: class I SAM-dependent methyltransferase [Candidatus Omnitrophica bacterium]|nr:class I SAM-dependent methyltransferase [Candidatus Omnitrophota bacterium]MDE2223234.1 class I SAM-dependent methyltransferase [Candidatus Omnitrophota bacterium]